MHKELLHESTFVNNEDTGGHGLMGLGRALCQDTFLLKVFDSSLFLTLALAIFD